MPRTKLGAKMTWNETKEKGEGERKDPIYQLKVSPLPISAGHFQRSQWIVIVFKVVLMEEISRSYCLFTTTKRSLSRRSPEALQYCSSHNACHGYAHLSNFIYQHRPSTIQSQKQRTPFIGSHRNLPMKSFQLKIHSKESNFHIEYEILVVGASGCSSSVDHRVEIPTSSIDRID